MATKAVNPDGSERKRTDQLARAVFDREGAISGEKLHLPFAEWMMGIPTMWTAVDYWVTASSLKQQQGPGRSCMKNSQGYAPSTGNSGSEIATSKFINKSTGNRKMSLEQQIETLTGAIGALADEIVELRLALKGARVEEITDDDYRAPEELAAEQQEEKPKAKPKARKKTPAEQPTKDDLVGALKALQAARDASAVKALLANFDAKVVGDLDPSRYLDVIEAAGAAA